ncbi:transposase [Brucella intermedia]|uniref:transposase n=1 Tax=Brucella intermedia TaxID=94625 RepID=UPI00224B80D7|nr:transposase [Brucella intermedia]
MRRQVRPFIVEVKQKRGHQKRGHSIWGDFDLSALAAETRETSDAVELPNIQLVDTSLARVETEDRSNPRAEHEMADPKEAEPVQTSSTEAPVTAEASEAKPEAKKKAPRSKVARAKPKRAAQSAAVAPAAVEPSTVQTKRKVYSSKERAAKLDQIEKSIASGGSVRSATKQAGISEQTYYQWKKAAEPSSESGDLKDLLALEEENKRLKSLLAERLRKENAELKRKLGLE